MRFCLGSLKIEGVLSSTGTDPSTQRHMPHNIEPKENLRLNLLLDCGGRALKPDLYLCQVILWGKKGGPTLPCNSGIFISQLAQAGIWGGWEVFSLFRRSKASASMWCVFSAGWDITGRLGAPENRHPVLV